MPKKSNMLRALLTVVLFCLLSVPSVSVILSLRLVVYSEQIGVSWSLASVPFSAPIDEPGQHTSRTALCVARALGRVTIACVSPPRDWAVSTGSHIQQALVFSWASAKCWRTTPLKLDFTSEKPR